MSMKKAIDEFKPVYEETNKTNTIIVDSLTAYKEKAAALKKNADVALDGTISHYA